MCHIHPSDIVAVNTGIGGMLMASARHWLGLGQDELVSEATFVVQSIEDENKAKPMAHLARNGRYAGSIPVSWLDMVAHTLS